MRRASAVVASALTLLAASAGSALAGTSNTGGQGGYVGQFGIGSGTGTITVQVNPGTCQAGCPTSIVNTNVALGFSLNTAQITQVLNQLNLSNVGSPTINITAP